MSHATSVPFYFVNLKPDSLSRYRDQIPENRMPWTWAFVSPYEALPDISASFGSDVYVLLPVSMAEACYGFATERNH